MNEEYIVVNQGTGELIGRLQPGDRIVRKKSIDELQSTIELDNNFIKLFTDNIMPVISQLKDSRGKIDYSTLTLMFYLMQFISYKTGLLQHENGEPLTNSFIVEDFNMNRSDIYRCLKTLKEKQIIAIVLREDKKQFYMFNPFIAVKGKRISKTSLHVFDDTIFNVFEQ